MLRGFKVLWLTTISRYEDSHGEIDSKEPPPIPLNFGPTGEA